MSAKHPHPCMVTFAGRPQALRCVLSNRRRSGLLVTPRAGKPVAIFANRRRAKRAIARTSAAAAAVQNTMLGNLPIFREKRAGGAWQIVEVAS